MRFEFAHKLVACLFSGLGLIALMLGASFGPVDSLLVTIGFAVSWFAEPPLIDRAGYSRFWNVAAVLLLLVQIARAVTGEATLTVGVQYAAFLQISRLCHRKTAADYQQIAILAFLHLIAGTVLSSGLEYGVVFFGFVIVMPWMLKRARSPASIGQLDPTSRARQPRAHQLLVFRRDHPACSAALRVDGCDVLRLSAGGLRFSFELRRSDHGGRRLWRRRRARRVRDDSRRSHRRHARQSQRSPRASASLDRDTSSRHLVRPIPRRPVVAE